LLLLKQLKTPLGHQENSDVIIPILHVFNLCFMCVQGRAYGETNDAQKNVFDLGAFVGDLTVEEDASRYGCSLFCWMDLCYLCIAWSM
jgi:hypothetical protein